MNVPVHAGTLDGPEQVRNNPLNGSMGGVKGTGVGSPMEWGNVPSGGDIPGKEVMVGSLTEWSDRGGTLVVAGKGNGGRATTTDGELEITV